MTAQHYWYFAAIVLVIMGWSARACADENVTIYGENASSGAVATASTASNASSGGSSTTTTKPKHHHKAKTASTASTSTSAAKKKTTASSGGSTPPAQFSPASAEPPGTGEQPPVSPASSHVVTLPPSTMPPAASTPSPAGPVTVNAPTWNPQNQPQITVSAPAPAAPPAADASGKPEVETGLPIARPGSKTYTLGSSFPLPPVLPVSTSGSYGDGKGLLDNFSFTNFSRRPKNIYPWKTRIITTEFWIGEGSTPISSTDNVESAWDENWRDSNGGSDTPGERDESSPNGYGPAHHAANVNPFYVALPFNDLAFPDKARRWLPAGWYRPPRNGKQVSACQHRWVEIKNAQGDICYAQWEDVGPLRYDHAEYVFGDERPIGLGNDHAGLDVSPAVFEYLSLDQKRTNVTSWRFVDDADVQPGAWLKYDEEALLFRAIRANNDKDSLPIQRARAPLEDPDDIDSSQKKVSKAKG
jgi:hypothetical protein